MNWQQSPIHQSDKQSIQTIKAFCKIDNVRGRIPAILSMEKPNPGLGANVAKVGNLESIIWSFNVQK